MSRVCLPGLLGIALLAGGATFGADQPATSQTKAENGKHSANKPVASEGVNAESKKPGKMRLPAHFGKIGLSAEQREQIKGVVDKYAGQIKDLETKITQLKADREKELHSLLSDVQKKALADAKAAAEKVRQQAKEQRAAAEKAFAESQVRAGVLAAKHNAHTKKVQEGFDKLRAKKQKADEAKSKTSAKEDAKESTSTEKQADKK